MKMKGEIKHMKKLLILAQILISVICIFSSCGSVTAITEGNSFHSDIPDVCVTLYDANENGIYVTIENVTPYDMTLSSTYTIERKSGKDWKESHFDELDLNSSKMKVVSLSDRLLFFPIGTFDVSRAGTYRLRTEFTYSTDNDENQLRSQLWLELDVKKISKHKTYNVTIDANSIELTKTKYKPGETVEFTPHILFDANALYFMNGKYLEEPMFTMPAEDVVIEERLIGGFNRPLYATELESAYHIAHPEVLDVTAGEIYGKYDSGAIVALFVPQGVEPSPYEETVLEYTFKHEGKPILVLYKKKLFTLSEAYNRGYLTEDNVRDIAKKYQE